MKQYQNEIILLLSFVLMIGGYLFKQSQIKTASIDVVQVEQSLSEIKELAGLINLWNNKKIAEKVSKVKNVISKSKVTWRKKGNKLTSSFKKLTSLELNRLINKIINLPVEIVNLKILKTGAFYKVEFKCKW